MKLTSKVAKKVGFTLNVAVRAALLHDAQVPPQQQQDPAGVAHSTQALSLELPVLTASPPDKAQGVQQMPPQTPLLQLPGPPPLPPGGVTGSSWCASEPATLISPSQPVLYCL